MSKGEIMKGMCLLNEIGIKNVRSLKNTEMQKLSPITILVGENSSGKSTFLRTFPLIKQSLLKRTSGPILWAGDFDDYVDFGSFKETVTNDGSNKISYTFSFKLDNNSYSSLLFNSYLDNRSIPIPNIEYEIIVAQKENENDFISEIKVKINETCYEINFKEQKFLIDNVVSEFSTSKHSNNYLLSPFYKNKSIFGFNLPDINQEIEKISKLINSNDTSSKIDFITLDALDIIGGKLVLGSDINNLEELLTKRRSGRNELINTSIKNFHNIFSQLGRVKQANTLRTLKMLYFYNIFPAIEDYVFNYFNNVHYIAPIRATAERYYRLRNLAVDEVDYQGKNLAIFLNSLSDESLENFQKWTTDVFGFSVVVKKSEGHLSLKLKLSTSDELVNLSDTGFGYSQILPIITQLWELISKKNNQKTPLVMAIEQPELHLHPAMQIKLVDAFIYCLKYAKVHNAELQLILETHSSVIINYIGECINDEKIDNDDVSIILFERNQSNNLTNVKRSTYDKDGYLQNWPYGFLR